MIVTDIRVAQFVESVVGKTFIPPYTLMGIERDGEVIGGVVFNIFEGNDCHVSVAGKGFNRGFLIAVGEYVFNQLGYGRMTAITEQTRIVRIAERLGGQIEGCLRDHFGEGRDGYVIGILRNEYKFLDQENN